MLNKEVVLQVNNLTKDYVISQSWFNKPEVLKAVNDVSFTLNKGEIISIVGESGSGKTTIARQLSLIETPTSGDILFKNESILNISKHRRKDFRKNVQMILQNPYTSFNPRKSIRSIIELPLILNTDWSKAEREEKMVYFMDKVGFSKDQLDRFPHMFSGGQRQRIAIARAMILNPSIVIADEPTSALDVSIQSQVLNLFMDLKDEFKTSFIFISHNLSVVKHISQQVLVLYLGKVVEYGSKESIFTNPLHPYTKALINANPQLDKDLRTEKTQLKGEIPSAINLPKGCAFSSRCPFATDVCKEKTPELRVVAGRSVSCHRVEEINA